MLAMLFFTCHQLRHVTVLCAFSCITQQKPPTALLQACERIRREGGGDRGYEVAQGEAMEMKTG